MKINQEKSLFTVFSLAWPIFFEVFFQFLLSFMDMYILSSYSDKAVGGVGVAIQIIQVSIILLKISGMGATILISQNLGAHNKKKAESLTVSTIIFNFLLGCLFGPILFLFSGFWAQLLNCPPELKVFCIHYLSIVGGTIVIKALYLAMSSILYSYGYTKVSMIISLSSNIVNVIGGWLVIFQPFGLPVLGVPGVAWVTVISSTLGLIAIFIFLKRKIDLPKTVSDTFKHFTNSIETLLKIGFPMALEQLLYNLAQTIITAIIGILGAITMSTVVYARSIMWLMEMCLYCLGMGIQIYTARLIGMNRKEEVKNLCFNLLYICWIINIIIPIVVYFSSDSIFGLFTKNNEILSIAKSLMALSIILVPAKVLNVIIGFTLKSAGDIKFGVILLILFSWIFCIPACYILGVVFKLGLPGIWIVCIIDEIIRGFIILGRFKRGKWETIDLLNDKAVTA